MGREVRMIKPGWEHPTDGFYLNGKIRYVPLLKGPYEEEVRLWDLKNDKWNEGLMENCTLENVNWRTDPWWKPKEDYVLEYDTYEEWAGDRPVPEDYMPTWAPGEATQYVMYETTSEGSPISPAFDTPEELARWLADNDASAFGYSTACYESWLETCKGKWAPSAVITNGVLQSGVEAMATPIEVTSDTRLMNLIEQRKEFSTIIDYIDNDPNVYSYAEECVLADKKSDAAISYYNLSKQIETLKEN